ncbi:glutamate receptor 2.9-like isoform X2 [Sesamum indicum]|uniref:Glutamate receptor n=1 Tax=Sesamum indicum TaxID=4182 RepID=A0A8M8UTV7_SESIN|nr:glutamate receptor 2.9-like isoform X2 [Sesamum indicum]
MTNAMTNIIKAAASFFLSHILFLFFFFHLHCQSAQNNSEQIIPSYINIGIIEDPNSPLDAMTSSCMEMAISDFYSAHPNYTTRLRTRTRRAESLLDADFAVLELLKQEQVHGVIGPQHSTEEKFITELGQKVHVPIISFTARISALPDIENHYFVRTAIDDAVQTRALAAICKGFQWAKVVILYEETDYGSRFISHLKRALQDVEIGQVLHPVAVPGSAKKSHLLKELSMLNKTQTGVFLVHMNPSLGFRLFTLAKMSGMMSKGYAWIITDSISNFLNSMDSVTRDSMEGVVGIRPYVLHLKKFQERWTRNSMVQNKNRGQVMDLNAYGLWAYDTITALAFAVEKIGPVNSSLLYTKLAKNGTKHGPLRISSFGPRLLRELSTTKFRGLSGHFELVDGKLKASAFEIFNVIGTGERRVGFWTPDGGIRRQFISSSDHDKAKTYSTSTAELKNIVWPGDSTTQPKSWSILPTRILRIGVPCKPGFKEFVNVTDIDPATNRTYNPTGFAIDIFNAMLKYLPFEIKYHFYYYNDTSKSEWTYDDMLHGIPRDFDMVVGDTTIWAPRASYVDFSLPYSESGVVLLVKNKKVFDMWIFTKPLRWDLWLAIGLSCIFMGIVIWILERPAANNPITPGEESVVMPETEQPGMTYLAPITVLAFPERNMVTNKWSLLVLVCWLFMAFILMQSFTANLSAILTVDQLKFAFSEDFFLGYHEASFMKKFLIETLNIKESRLRGYSSVEGFHDAMCRGSKNGGIDAIFDEIPYMKLLMNRYDSQYKTVGPTYRTDGLGFAFPLNSPLTAYFSRAILNVTQSSEMTTIEQKNFGPGYSSQDPLSSTISQGTSSLNFKQFSGLFIIVASVTIFALICSQMPTLSKLTNITKQLVNKYCCRTTTAGINVERKMAPNSDQDDADATCIEVVEIPWSNEADVVQDVEREIKGGTSSTDK